MKKAVLKLFILLLGIGECFCIIPSAAGEPVQSVLAESENASELLHDSKFQSFTTIVEDMYGMALIRESYDAGITDSKIQLLMDLIGQRGRACMDRIAPYGKELYYELLSPMAFKTNPEENLYWLAENVFNVDEETIRLFKERALQNELSVPYLFPLSKVTYAYKDGYYYTSVFGWGEGKEDSTVEDIVKKGNFYIVKLSHRFDYSNEIEYYRALVSVKEYHGETYYSIYKVEPISETEDFSQMEIPFVYQETIPEIRLSDFELQDLTDDSVEIKMPSYGMVEPYYQAVYGTGTEGLELRTGPSSTYRSFGPVPEGTLLLLEAIEDKWAYTWYNGHHGWVHTDYLRDDSELIWRVQQKLNESGYGCGIPDGNAGPATKAALHSYQQEHGLQMNDHISLNLVNKMGIGDDLPSLPESMNTNEIENTDTGMDYHVWLQEQWDSSTPEIAEIYDAFLQKLREREVEEDSRRIETNPYAPYPVAIGDFTGDGVPELLYYTLENPTKDGVKTSDAVIAKAHIMKYSFEEKVLYPIITDAPFQDFGFSPEWFYDMAEHRYPVNHAVYEHAIIMLPTSPGKIYAAIFSFLSVSVTEYTFDEQKKCFLQTCYVSQGNYLDTEIHSDFSEEEAPDVYRLLETADPESEALEGEIRYSFQNYQYLNKPEYINLGMTYDDAIAFLQR